jgi:hypothetical protein
MINEWKIKTDETMNDSNKNELDLFFKLVKDKEERWRQIRSRQHYICDCCTEGYIVELEHPCPISGLYKTSHSF